MSPKSPVIVGIDEAGRGALAGPVVAGACVLIEGLGTHSFIRDSKMLTPEEREEAFSWIEKSCLFGYGIVEAEYVDAHGILAATELAMTQALEMLSHSTTPTYLLVDGRDKFWFNYPHSSIIRGDESEPCISAGSIVAKVIRDRLMTERSPQFPNYKFHEHKGYGTPLHLEALEMFGPCAIHRKTFLTRVEMPVVHSSHHIDK